MNGFRRIVEIADTNYIKPREYLKVKKVLLIAFVAMMSWGLIACGNKYDDSPETIEHTTEREGEKADETSGYPGEKESDQPKQNVIEVTAGEWGDDEDFPEFPSDFEFPTEESSPDPEEGRIPTNETGELPDGQISGPESQMPASESELSNKSPGESLESSEEKVEEPRKPDISGYPKLKIDTIEIVLDTKGNVETSEIEGVSGDDKDLILEGDLIEQLAKRVWSVYRYQEFGEEEIMDWFTFQCKGNRYDLVEADDSKAKPGDTSVDYVTFKIKKWKGAVMPTTSK